MNKSCGLIILIMMVASKLIAQNELPDTLKLNYQLNSNANISLGNIQRILIQNTVYTRVEKKSFGADIAIAYTFGSRGNGIKTENDWVVQARMEWLKERRVFPITFQRFETNLLRKLVRRIHAGGGAGVRLFTNTANKLVGYNGAVWERSTYINLPTLTVARFVFTIEGSHMFSANKISITEKLSWLPAFTKGARGNNLAMAQCTITVPVVKHLSFSLTTAYTYETVIAPGSKNENLSFTYGLVYSNHR